MIELNVNPINPETDDVGSTIACEISEKTWMFFDTPTCLVTKVIDDSTDFSEFPIALIKRHIHPIFPKTDNVSSTIACQVCEEAWMFFDTPIASCVAEVVDHFPDFSEFPIALIKRHINPIFPKADDVGSTIACQVGEEAWMFFDTPIASCVAEVVDHFPDITKGAIAVIERHINPVEIGRAHV